MALRFTSTRLLGKNKKGILKPDENGYYIQPIGALNVFNSNNDYYVAEGAEQLFLQSSSFMRRVKAGALRAELGHPDYMPGMTDDDYLARILEIRETNTIAHFADIWLDRDFGRNNPEVNNPNLIAIMGKIKPWGPHANILKESFENPLEESCFSIRSLTRDYVEGGIRKKEIKQIVTFDYVNEPGIHIARKSFSPVLESIDLIKKDISMESLKIIDFLSRKKSYSNESDRTISMETISILKDMIMPELNQTSRPLAVRW